MSDFDDGEFDDGCLAESRRRGEFAENVIRLKALILATTKLVGGFGYAEPNPYTAEAWAESFARKLAARGVIAPPDEPPHPSEISEIGGIYR